MLFRSYQRLYPLDQLMRSNEWYVGLAIGFWFAPVIVGCACILTVTTWAAAAALRWRIRARTARTIRNAAAEESR